MRTISFVERLELEFHGKSFGQQQPHPWSLCQQAIALGDVDNDNVRFTLLCSAAPIFCISCVILSTLLLWNSLAVASGGLYLISEYFIQM